MKQRFITLALIISFLLGYRMFTAADETKETEKTKTNSEEKKNSKSLIELYQPEKITKINKENWIEPDDEEFYKFDINPITPKEGITGGILIYYGHFIKPPYKVETRGDGLNEKVFVNNIQIFPIPKGLSKRISKRWKDKNRPKVVIYEWEVRSFEREKAIREEMFNYLINLFKKYKLTKEGKQKAFSEFEIYLKKHKEVDSYKIEPNEYIQYKIKGGGYPYPTIYMENIERFLKPKEQLEFEKREWHKELVRGRVRGLSTDLSSQGSVYHECRANSSYKFNILNNLAEVLTYRESKIIKIKLLYEIFGKDLNSAKFLYYNFDLNTFRSYFGENHDN